MVPSQVSLNYGASRLRQDAADTKPQSRSRNLKAPLQHFNEGEQHEAPGITQSDTATRGMFSGNDIPASRIGT